MKGLKLTHGDSSRQFIKVALKHIRYIEVIYYISLAGQWR